jgi:hypothetical protein
MLGYRSNSCLCVWELLCRQDDREAARNFAPQAWVCADGSGGGGRAGRAPPVGSRRSAALETLVYES